MPSVDRLIEQEITAIREIVTDHPVRAYLEEVGVYGDICDAMDGVVDTIGSSQLDHVNTLVGWVGLPQLETPESIAEVLSEVRERLAEEQRKGIYQKLIESPVTSFFLRQDTGYMLEKISGATSSEVDAALAAAAVATMRPRVEQFRDALNKRGLYGDDMTADVLYVFNRTDAYLKHLPDRPVVEDLRIMTQVLRPLVAEMEKAARDIDSEEKEKAR